MPRTLDEPVPNPRPVELRGEFRTVPDDGVEAVKLEPRGATELRTVSTLEGDERVGVAN